MRARKHEWFDADTLWCMNNLSLGGNRPVGDHDAQVKHMYWVTDNGLSLCPVIWTWELVLLSLVLAWHVFISVEPQRTLRIALMHL